MLFDFDFDYIIQYSVNEWDGSREDNDNDIDSMICSEEVTLTLDLIL